MTSSEPQPETAVRRLTIRSLTLYPLTIPLRGEVSHAAASRRVAEPVIVEVESQEGRTGFGETLPRPYVTGETVESVLADLRGPLLEAVLGFHPASFGEALEFIEALPWRAGEDRLMAAARAAVELALLDASMRCFNRHVDDIVSWLGQPGFGTPGSLRRIRYSGVLATADRGRLRRRLRLMWWGGLRHFKLKVGTDDDERRIATVLGFLRRPLARGRATLRLDANGAWTREQAIERLGDMKNVPVAGVEQPLPRGREEDLVILRDLFDFPIIHDESLVTAADAERLIALGVADAFNIRVSKCGGLLPALRLAGMARRHGASIQLGCMVGETSLLTGAGLIFLAACPDVAWAEGAFGKLLLLQDIGRRSLRFGYAGRPPALPHGGLGVEVETSRLRTLCRGEPTVLHL